MRGITDLIFDSLQFDDGLFLCRRGHPAHSLNVILHCSLDGMHHFNRAGFAPRRKCAVHVSLTEGLTQVTIGGASATPPARKLLFLAG